MTYGKTKSAVIAVALIVTGLLGGCASNPSSGESTDHSGPLAAIFGPVPQRTGAQLWADNCTRCHYVRPPDYYSAPQWALVVRHMRSRADLTGVEERKIVEFLQSGSGAD